MVSKRSVVAVVCSAGIATVCGSGARAADPVPALPLPLPPSVPVLTASAQSEPSAQQTGSRATTVAVQALAARAVTAEINRVRRLHKLRPLRISSRLARAATEHVKALAFAGQFRHEWPDGAAFSTWIRRYYPPGRFRRWSVGENLVWQSPELDARAAVQMWLASAPHRRNLLRPAWREVGLGVVSAQGAQGAYGGSDVQVAAAEFGVRAR